MELTPELKALFDGWVSLTPEQKDAISHRGKAGRALAKVLEENGIDK